MIRTIVLVIFYLIMIALIGPIGILWTLISGRIDWLYQKAMWAAYAGVRLVGVKVDLRGYNDFDHNGTYIYMCNHVSNLDPPIVIPLIPRRTSVLVKKEVFRVPILAQAMRMARFVAVDRRNRDAAIASIQAATEVMRSGINMAIFPEGTRSPDGKLLPFKKGPFHLAMESKVPILPISISGTETMMGKGTIWIKQGTATLVFHSPIRPEDFIDRDVLTEAVRAAIASGLPERMRNGASAPVESRPT
ncbi:MAG TPA: lysophospholipid acyltransferase family protein [Terriglobales bacterium]|nr:lysophospholipid acyltransferase family protein [Terriglobales bacterium]